MTTSKSIRQEFCEEFKQHLISADHNVIDSYDQEFSFHVVCHPEIDLDGNPIMPESIKNYIEEVSDEYKVMFYDSHVHIHVRVADELLGIEDDLSQVDDGQDDIMANQVF